RAALPCPLLLVGELPPTLAPGAAFFAAAAAPSELALPDSALSLRFYHNDHLGSSTVISDAAGQLVAETDMYPFGSLRSHFQTRGVHEPYQFTHKERDAESGLSYFESR